MEVVMSEGCPTLQGLDTELQTMAVMIHTPKGVEDSVPVSYTGCEEDVSDLQLTDAAEYTVGMQAPCFSGEQDSSDILVPCRLCLSEFHLTDMYTLWQCRCTYCIMCVKQYLLVMIAEGNILKITCPDGKCKRQGTIEAEEVERLVDTYLFERYTRLKFLREVEMDPERAFCPAVGCENVCLVQLPEGGIPVTPQRIQCLECNLVFCSMCKLKWHDKQSCDEAMRSSGRMEDEGIPFNCQEDANIKRCPLCFVPIERNDGCAQMMCKQCKHVFCWYCLASLDDDFLLRHYDKGPCKNKLGHSRASVIWHRTQVVGIFAGFSVLLLVASPFLLLAAPCILCCKCKACKCCDEDDLGDTFTSS